MRILPILLLLGLEAAAQTPAFTPAGTWGAYPRYNMTICAPVEMTLTGATIFRLAQTSGKAPLTHSQLRYTADQANKQSVAAIVRTVGLAVTGISTALQAGGAVGKNWQDQYRAIAPAAGALLVVAQLVADRQAPEPLAVPDDYLPSAVQIPANGCIVTTIIGGTQ